MHSEALILPPVERPSVRRTRCTEEPKKTQAWRARALAWFRRPMTPEALRRRFRGDPRAVAGCPGCDAYGLCGTHGWPAREAPRARRLAAVAGVAQQVLFSPGPGVPRTPVPSSLLGRETRPPSKRPKASRAPRSGAPADGARRRRRQPRLPALLLPCDFTCPHWPGQAALPWGCESLCTCEPCRSFTLRMHRADRRVAS